MKAGESLLICDFKFLGAAYELVHQIPNGVAAQVDLIPTSEGAVLLVAGPMDHLLELLRKARELSSNRIIENLSESLIEAYLGVSNPPLNENLIVFESRLVGDVFEAAQRLEREGAKVFDLRILRGGTPRAYLLSTSPKKETPISVDGLSGHLSAMVTPGPHLREFFATSPQR